MKDADNKGILNRLNIPIEKINFETMDKALDDLFIKMEHIYNQLPEDSDAQNLMSDYLDWVVDNNGEKTLGVNILSLELHGENYTTENGKKVKKQPMNPEEVYKRANKLIDTVNKTIKIEEHTKSRRF